MGYLPHLLANGGSFWFGVTASFVGGLILMFLGMTWRTWLGSTIRNMVASTTVDITGDYVGEYWEEGDEDVETGPNGSDETASPNRDPDGTESITLKQQGRHVSGTITRDIPGGADRVAKFVGECADRHVTATYKSTDQANPERGSFCLKITNGGTVLRGGYLWYNTKEGRESVDYGRYVWKRKK